MDRAQRCKSFRAAIPSIRHLPPIFAAVLPDHHPFLVRLLAAVEHDLPEAAHWPLDHLCYRVDSAERYTAMKQVLCENGVLLAESLIGGRPIATYRLHHPLRFQERSIHVIEVPSPKPGSAYSEGWEHAEFVVDVPLATLVETYPQLPWELDDLHKPVNPDVRLRYAGFSVKFHERALEAVIASERGATSEPT